MDANRFDALIRTLPSVPRRGVLAGLGGGLLAALPFSASPSAAKKRRKRKKQLQRNEFGCVDVGKACRGNGANCCSGICDGDKPKQGKRDRSRCVAHDASTCFAGQSFVECGGVGTACVTTTGNQNATCVTTTGKAPYCARSAQCAVCKKDADCVAVCGPGAACFPCAAQCPQTGGTACGGLDNSCAIMM